MRSFISLIWFCTPTSCRLLRNIGSLLSKCTRRKLRTKFEKLMTGPTDSTETKRNDDFTLGVVEGKSTMPQPNLSKWRLREVSSVHSEPDSHGTGCWFRCLSQSVSGKSVDRPLRILHLCLVKRKC